MIFSTTTNFNCSYSYENTFLSEQDKPKKSLHSDVPYIMTASSFNKYIRQNATEFNKEYAKCIEMSNKTDETRKEFNNQSRQTIHSTNCEPETRITSKLVPPEIKNEEISKCSWSQKINVNNFIGYCFCVLRNGVCNRQPSCKYKHDVSILIHYFVFFLFVYHLYILMYILFVITCIY